jgi:hypothetical protein
MTRGRDTRIALAFSGGGYRATLYSLGVCMALVDRELNRRVIQVSSVSGGSILNAALAQHGTCFAELTPEEFDEIAQDVASAIAYRPALSRRWIGAYLALMLICGAASWWASYAAGLPGELRLVVAAVGAGVPLLWLGHFVTWRLQRSMFRAIPPERSGSCRKVRSNMSSARATF